MHKAIRSREVGAHMTLQVLVRFVLIYIYIVSVSIYHISLNIMYTHI